MLAETHKVVYSAVSLFLPLVFSWMVVLLVVCLAVLLWWSLPSNAELLNLDTAITALSALMLVILVPSAGSYEFSGCGYGSELVGRR